MTSLMVMAADDLSNLNQISDQRLIYQQERQKALETALKPEAADIRLLPPMQVSGQIDFPTETICFPIHKVNLLERDKISYLIPLDRLAKQAQGRCIGGQGINLLMKALQNKLISRGYITTRIVAPAQDLTKGELTLVLVKGVTRHIDYSADSDHYASLYTAMPVRSGQILDLREIEQGLENLQRLPTVQADMQIVPGDQPGESDIVIHRTQSRFWRIGASLDNSGTRETGRYQGGLTFYLDNPFQLSDAFYVSAGRNLEGEKDRYGSHNSLISYSVPFGFWQFSASLSDNKYFQTVAGIPENYQYSGRSRNINLQLSRVLHRNESQKTTLSYGINLRRSHNYIDDEEIDVQQRKTTSWQIGLQHRHYIGQNTLNLDFNYQKGVRWFGAMQAPEEYIHEGTALSDIFHYNLSLSVPFSLARQSLRYDVALKGQYSRQSLLTPQDRFSIGGRWSVRGFDGELTLSADRGYTISNELSLSLPNSQELYAGIDYGRVYGASSDYLQGHYLSGGGGGLRGGLWGFYYDLFVGAPIYKPEAFKTDRVTMSFNLNWSY
ncbi:ShlB/FhaC/HecB family hemolysin secretion/activation protein [Utexia brackfieldae]